MPKAGSICARSSLLGALGVLLAQSALGQDLAVTAVRHWSLGSVTRIAIEVNQEFRYKTDRLSGPDRIFFDFPGAHSKVSRKIMHVIPVGDGLLKQIRVAETAPGVTRVVLDVENSDIEHVASQLSNPDRLMIELRMRGSKPAEPIISSTEMQRPKKFEPPPERASTSLTPPANLPAPPPVRPSIQRPAPQPTTGSEMAAAKIPVPSPDLSAPKPPVEPGKAASPAKRSSSGNSSLTRALGLKVGRILLDAGHGGHDTGSIGVTGLLEKDLVLDVTRRLGELIEKNLGAEVIYTRSDDTFVPLEGRAEMANAKKADLFLSIHANSSPLRYVSGTDAYYLSFTTSRAALEVASRENAGSQRSVHELEEILQKIALKEKVDESREFALKVQSALTVFHSKTTSRPRDRGIKKAPFVVLIGAQMPSVLAEIGFLSNAREESLLKQGDHRQRIAEALYKGLSQYAGTLSHFQVARTSAP
jgi:N-acetylmuramoyl-L-alanine amidase